MKAEVEAGHQLAVLEDGNCSEGASSYLIVICFHFSVCCLHISYIQFLFIDAHTILTSVTFTQVTR